MDILRLTKIILLILLFLTSCREVERNRYDYNHKKIVLEQWDSKNTHIYKISLVQYEKGTNFSSEKKEYKLDSVFDYTKEHDAIFLRFLSPILTDKDYKLTINDSVTYRLKDIETSYKIKPYMPLSIDSVYNMIKSININGKEYFFDKPRVFTIPKEAHSSEKNRALKKTIYS